MSHTLRTGVLRSCCLAAQTVSVARNVIKVYIHDT